MNRSADVLACRAALRGRLNVAEPSHSGLVLDRYLSRHAGGNPSSNDSEPTPKSEVLEAAKQAIQQASPLYAAAFRRYAARLNVAVRWTMRTESPLIVGLGAANPLEAGLRLHHTFGCPVIPGTAIKGVTAHYCAEVLELDAETRRVLFGTSDESGMLVFHDAWILPESVSNSLKLDVITVHHPKYYAGESSTPDGSGGSLAPPSDMDDPIPVGFLHVVGSFEFAVTPLVHSVRGEKWAQYAKDLVVRALEDWGIGAKTRSGYGRLSLASKQDEVRAEPTSVVRADPAKVVPADPGRKIRVRRIEDPKGKDRLWFEAVDGSGIGNLLPPDKVDVEIGEEVDLYVKANSPTYNFRLQAPETKRKGDRAANSPRKGGSQRGPNWK